MSEIKYKEYPWWADYGKKYDYRLAVQKEAVKALLESKGGTVVLPPRFGKSKIGIDFLKAVKAQRALIVVHGVQQKHKWKEELKRWQYCCYAALTTYQYLSMKSDVQKRLHFDVIILDEAHHITDKTYNILKQLSYDYIIGLTATYPDDLVKRSFLMRLGLQIVYKRDIKESVDKLVNRDFRLYLLPVEPTRDELDKFVRMGDYARRKIDLEEKRLAFVNRARFLYSLNSKIKVVKKLYDMLKKKGYRGLTFVNSKKYGNALDRDRFLHSGRGKLFIENMIENYNLGNLNSLVILQVANEGIEFEDTDYIVFGSLHGSFIKFFQRLGRALNAITNQGIATVIVPVVKHTSEEEWLTKISKRLRVKPQVIKIEDIHEIIEKNKNS